MQPHERWSWHWSGRPGWDLRDAVAQVCLRINPTKYLEIGVDGGGTLDVVLENAKPELIYLCDIWNPNYEGHGLSNHQHIGKILKRRGYADARQCKTVFLDGDSKEMIPQAIEPNVLFDLILVDGDHSYKGARADLTNTWPLLRTGGVLIFDDVWHVNYPHLVEVYSEFMVDKLGVARPVYDDEGRNTNCVVLQKQERE